MYGETGKSDEMKLESKSDSFEQGQCDKFIVCLCVFIFVSQNIFVYLSVITVDNNISVDKFDVLFLTRCPEP